jgi:hypothetical protein
MNDLVEQILECKYDEANLVLERTMTTKLTAALHAAKKKLAAKNYPASPEMRSMSGKTLKKVDIKPKTTNEESIDEEEDATNLEEARINIVKARIRGGKVQRRTRVSNVPGMTLRGGKLTRMSVSERRRRKLGARKAHIKTRSKRAQITRKRQISLMKRKRLGI